MDIDRPKITVVQSILTWGDPLQPLGSDLITQIATIPVGSLLPADWHPLTGNAYTTQIVRTVYRDTIELENMPEKEVVTDDPAPEGDEAASL